MNGNVVFHTAEWLAAGHFGVHVLCSPSTAVVIGWGELVKTGDQICHCLVLCGSHVKTRVDAPVGGHWLGSQDGPESVKDLSNYLSMDCVVALIWWKINRSKAIFFLSQVKQTSWKLVHSNVVVALLPPFICDQPLQQAMVSPSQMSCSAFHPSLLLYLLDNISPALST